VHRHCHLSVSLTVRISESILYSHLSQIRSHLQLLPAATIDVRSFTSHIYPQGSSLKRQEEENQKATG